MKNKEYFFEGLPIDFKTKIDFDLIDDKYKLKQLLAQSNLPYPEGRSFISRKKGFKYGLKLGFPLIVKPRDGSLSNHVSINIINEHEFLEAINIAKEVSINYIVEKFIPGDVYRITIIKDKIFAAKRMPASVIGNGINTIAELIKEKNKDPRRGKPDQKNSTLHQITVDEIIHDILSKQNLSIDSILNNSQKVFLKQKVIVGLGGDVIDVTEKIHEHNKRIFFQLAQKIQTPLLGLDYICDDITKSWQEQTSAIIEANSLPYIDMHHYPSEGQSQNVAKAIIEEILLK